MLAFTFGMFGDELFDRLGPEQPAGQANRIEPECGAATVTTASATGAPPGVRKVTVRSPASAAIGCSRKAISRARRRIAGQPTASHRRATRRTCEASGDRRDGRIAKA